MGVLEQVNHDVTPGVKDRGISATYLSYHCKSLLYWVVVGLGILGDLYEYLNLVDQIRIEKVKYMREKRGKWP